MGIKKHRDKSKRKLQSTLHLSYKFLQFLRFLWVPGPPLSLFWPSNVREPGETTLQAKDLPRCQGELQSRKNKSTIDNAWQNKTYLKGVSLTLEQITHTQQVKTASTKTLK